MKKIVLLVLCLIFVVVISGCAGTLSPEEIAKNSREVKAFLEEYSRATIVASLVSNANIQEECDNAQLVVKDYWKIKIEDPDTNTTIISYIDNDSKNTVCIVKTGGTAKEEKPKANESEEEVKKEEPKEEDKNEVTLPEEVDLCKDVVCEDSTKTCPDKFEARCVNVCSKGVCSFCTPDCSGHEECIEDWSCSEWSECSQSGTQTKTCTDKNNCRTTKNKPSESQSCLPPTCGHSDNSCCEGGYSAPNDGGCATGFMCCDNNKCQSSCSNCGNLGQTCCISDISGGGCNNLKCVNGICSPKQRSATLSIDNIQITLGNLYPMRLTVTNTGEAEINPKFDISVTKGSSEVCSGAPFVSEFTSVAAGSGKPGEITLLGCMFSEDGDYTLTIDLLDSDYTKLDSKSKGFNVNYWSQFK